MIQSNFFCRSQATLWAACLSWRSWTCPGTLAWAELCKACWVNCNRHCESSTWWTAASLRLMLLLWVLASIHTCFCPDGRCKLLSHFNFPIISPAVVATSRFLRSLLSCYSSFPLCLSVKVESCPSSTRCASWTCRATLGSIRK